jgi:hypothetical protein
MISHNAEFYASGRQLRNSDGKLRKLLGPVELRSAIQQAGGDDILVLVPLEWLHQLQDQTVFPNEVIASNGDLAVAIVRDDLL